MKRRKKAERLPFDKPERTHKPKAHLRVEMPEKDIQGMAEDLCEGLGIRYFRIPDKLLGFLRVGAPVWVRVFVARYLAGVPDMMLFRALPDGRNEVVFIEIKTEAGKLSLNQSKWHSGLNVKVTHGWDETRDAIMKFHEERLRDA